MFKVKFETRDFKYFLKLGDNEVCLSSETPKDIYNDNDIEDIVNRALEAYHEYVFSKFKEESQKYIPQPYTQKLIDRGVLKFSETFNNEKHYNITPNYIMNYCSDSTDIRDTTVNVFVEVYDENNNFKIFTCIFCEDTDDVNVTPDDLLIYKIEEV